MKLTRSNALWTLVIATAVTGALQYVIQGVLVTGHRADFLSETYGNVFWVVEGWFWAIRMIVEATVIAFVFSTKTSDERQVKLLNFFEVALIALIALTLGPALAVTGYNLTMREVLPTWAYWAWSFGVASYIPLMLGAASYSYKCDSGVTTVQQVVLTEVRQESPDLDKTIVRGDLMEQLLAILGNQNPSSPFKQKEIAVMLGVTEPAMSRLVKQAVGEGLVSKNGHLGLMRIIKEVEA